MEEQTMTEQDSTDKPEKDETSEGAQDLFQHIKFYCQKYRVDDFTIVITCSAIIAKIIVMGVQDEQDSEKSLEKALHRTDDISSSLKDTVEDGLKRIRKGAGTS